MNYFLLSQDRDYKRTPQIKNFISIALRKDFTPENCKRIKDINIVDASSDAPLTYIDLLDTQAFLVSAAVKKVLMMYDPALRFKMFCLLNKSVQGGENGEYYAPIFRRIDCLSPNSKCNLDKSHIEKMVLFKHKIGCAPFFCVDRIQKEAVIVRLDAAESLLRRNLRGLKFEKVEVE